MVASTDGSRQTVRTDDWPSQAADAIVKVVGTVRDATTTKAVKVAKIIVYGVPIAIAAVTLVILLVIMFERIVNLLLPDSVFGETHMWAAHMIVGGVFSAAGVILLRLAKQPEPVADA